jgi:diketogulonate reductase-like aldo/keto reductase
MADLIDEGKVRWAGVCNFDAEQLERCEAIRHVDSAAATLPAPPAARVRPCCRGRKHMGRA